MILWHGLASDSRLVVSLERDDRHDQQVQRALDEIGRLAHRYFGDPAAREACGACGTCDRREQLGEADRLLLRKMRNLDKMPEEQSLRDARQASIGIRAGLERAGAASAAPDVAIRLMARGAGVGEIAGRVGDGLLVARLRERVHPL